MQDGADRPGEPRLDDARSAPSGDEGAAIKDPLSHVRLWLVAAVGLAVDLWTKHWAFTRLEANPGPEDVFVAIPNLVSLRRSLNPGALFGLGKGLTPLFIGASILALGFVLFLFWNSGRNRRSLHIALGLVLAGALGNLYDRAYMIADVVKFNHDGRRVTVVGKVTNPGEEPIMLGTWPTGDQPRRIGSQLEPEVREQGVVRDFVKIEPHFSIGGYRIELWPWVFNVADVLLVVGVGVLMLNFWWERKEEHSTAVDSADGAATTPDTDPAKAAEPPTSA